MGSQKKVKFIPPSVMVAIPGMGAVATRMMKAIVKDIHTGGGVQGSQQGPRQIELEASGDGEDYTVSKTSLDGLLELAWEASTEGNHPTERPPKDGICSQTGCGRGRPLGR